MKKLFILLVILILGSCKPNWNDPKRPAIITSASIYNTVKFDTIYKYQITKGINCYYIKSYNLYNIGDTIEIKIK